MNEFKFKKKKNITLICIFFIFFSSSFFVLNLNHSNGVYNPNHENPSKTIKNSVKTTAQFDRDGKVFETINKTQRGCYINNDNPGLNVQPKIYIPNQMLSYAEMSFKNIEAINYTYELENNPSEFVMNTHSTEPLYVYQKFWVEIDQYVNNVSVFIQDINNKQSFTESNSWEVAIVNCSNDSQGSPNQNKTLGLTTKPHPIVIAAHWEFFDFKNSEVGPIYLDTSKTNNTVENGITKFWFAIKIRVPPEDSANKEGPKLIYFNPDGGDVTNKGVGDIFADFPDTKYAASFHEFNVVDFSNINGTKISGTLDSFKSMDTDRYLAQSKTNNLTLMMNFELTNIANFTEFYEFAKNYPTEWEDDHANIFYGFDIKLSTNISDTSIIQNADLWLYNHTYNKWENGSDAFDVIRENENFYTLPIRDAASKMMFFEAMNRTDEIYSLDFKINYTSSGAQFNVSINQFTISVLLSETVPEIVLFDPTVQEQYYPIKAVPINGTTSPYGGQSINNLKSNDDINYRAQSDTNNLTVEFEYDLVPYLDSSSWDFDLNDYYVLYPNPVVASMQLKISSNVSIDNQNNLTTAVLEIYKGDFDSIWLDYIIPGQRYSDWVNITGQKEFANGRENQEVITFNHLQNWLILQVLNSSTEGSNILKMRLRYEWNGSLAGTFNVSIDEISLTLSIQNAISSDIACTIGLGLNSENLNPSDINLQNLGKNVPNSGPWKLNTTDGTPTNGFYEFEVTSLWRSISFDVYGEYEVYKHDVKIKFIETPETQYLLGTHYYSVNVTSWDGIPLEDLEIIFEIIDINDKVIVDAAAVTNANGTASSSLNFEKIGNNYSLIVKFNEEGYYSSSEIISSEFRVVSELILGGEVFLEVLPSLLILSFAFAGMITMKKRYTSKMREYWSEEAQILDDLLKISYIMIIHKEIGLTIYNKQIALDLDPDLIGGFITAISQFRSEIKEDTSDAKIRRGFEMEYYDFKIVLTDSENARVALILEGTPSDKLKLNQWNFTDDFEKKFEKIFKQDTFSGDITPFKATEELVEQSFNISLTYPLKLGEVTKQFHLDPLEKALLDVAKEILKEKKFFFISSLLSFGIAGRNESRDQIVTAILNLKRKGLIVPITIE